MAERKIRLVRRIDKIKLQHVGNRGPQGIQGIQGDPATNIVQSVNGKIGTVVLQKQDIGLDQVDNTSDANKPVSTAQQAALDTKATTTALNAHASSTTNPHQVTKAQVGLGNVDNTSDTNKPISTATQAALDTKATTTALDAHANDTLNPHQVTKAQVGLGNVDNTSDANKPVSTATQSALDLKANTSALAPVALSGAFPDLTGTPSIVNTLTGTANQVIASGASGNVTLSLPQDIGTGSSPTFGGLTVDTNSIIVDGVNHRVGIGIAPNISYKLTVGGSIRMAGGNFAFASGSGAIISNASTGNIAFQGWSGTANTFGLNFDANGNVVIGGSSSTQTGTHSLTLPSTATGIALYNTADQTTNFERFRGFMSGNVMNLVNETGGTGTMRNLFVGIGTGWGIGTTYSPGTATKITTSIATTSLAGNIMVDSGTFTAAGGTQTLKAFLSTYNQTGTASSADLIINRIENSLGSGSHFFQRYQVGGVDRFTIDNTGQFIANSPNTVSLHQFNNTSAFTGANSNSFSLRLSNASGAQTQAFKIESLLISPATAGAESSQVKLWGLANGSAAQLLQFYGNGLYMYAAGGFNFADATNMLFNPTTGTKIATATTQKFAFWGKTPIVQPANSTAIDTVLTSTGLRASGGSANFDTVIMPLQAVTVSAPAYVKGGIYFDTTKNKLMVGGASAWETSATDYSDLTGIPQDISTTASPTFNNLTANGYLFAGGNYNATPTTPGIYAGIPTGLSPRFTMVPTSGNVRAFDNAAGGIVRLINSSTGTVQMVASANGLFAFGPSLFGLDPTHTITLPSTATGIALYNTVDQTTNYERLRTYWSGNTAYIATERGGTGAGRALTLIGVNSSQFTLSDVGYAGVVRRDFTGIGILNITSSSMVASSGVQSVAAITPTYNQTGTAGSTDLLINRTETALGSGSHSFVDLQVGGSSRFTIYRSGALSTSVVGGSQGFTINAAPATAYLDNNISNTLTGSTANQANLHFLVKDSAGNTLRALQWINKLSNITVGSRQSYVGLTVYDTDAQATALEFWGKNMTVYGNLTIADGMNIITSTTTGTKIGSSAANKLSLWGKTPIAQPTTAIAASTFTANTGTAINDASTFGGYTIKQIAQALINVGLLA